MIAPSLSQYNLIGPATLKTILSLAIKFIIQIASFAASAATIHSASVVDPATVFYLELFQLTAPPLRVKM